MEQVDYILEIHKTRKAPYKPRGSQYMPYGNAYRVFGSLRRLRPLRRYLMRKGYCTYLFPKANDRSINYRQIYFESTPPDKKGRYHCVYCGKSLDKSAITVDHIIPIHAVKTNDRRALRLLRGRNVNDSSNLVAACARCNRTKGKNMRIQWRIKASLGRKKGFFIVRNIFILGLLIAIFYLVYKIYIVRFASVSSSDLFDIFEDVIIVRDNIFTTLHSFQHLFS